MPTEYAVIEAACRRLVSEGLARGLKFTDTGFEVDPKDGAYGNVVIFTFRHGE